MIVCCGGDFRCVVVVWRGGPHSADHVDILGNVDAVTDLLKIVTDFETDGLEDHIVSDIVPISQKISKHNAL
eukprot:scaffold3111_cov263-Chaetoceros_neogracile.AAC.28